MKVFAVLLATTAFLACEPLTIVSPPTGPGTEWPCGVNGHECTPNMCCDDGFVCCDGTSCTKGMCEYVGEGRFGAKPDGGEPAVVPARQWRKP